MLSCSITPFYYLPVNLEAIALNVYSKSVPLQANIHKTIKIIKE